MSRRRQVVQRSQVGDAIPRHLQIAQQCQFTQFHEAGDLVVREYQASETGEHTQPRQVLDAEICAVQVAQLFRLGDLEALNLTSGFSFLDRTIGWSYSIALIDISIDDT